MARYSRFTWCTMPMPGGTTPKVLKACWPHFRNSIALAVALEFHVHVQAASACGGSGEIDLHGVIDHEIDRHERLDDFRIAA